MVESGKKGKAWMKSVQDAGIFRPSYGKMGMRLSATNRVPMLLMSATCPPDHRDLIYANLKIKKEDIVYVEGELARPEITILRLPMQNSKSSLNDLKNVLEHRWAACRPIGINVMSQYWYCYAHRPVDG
jgi:superfamily II DNA helicase RecQ